MSVTDILTTMRVSAHMLKMADHTRPKINVVNVKQADRLMAAAESLEKQLGAKP